LALLVGARLPAAEEPKDGSIKVVPPCESGAAAQMGGRLIASTPLGWHRLPSYPRTLGVAGIIAGQHQGEVIAAGGANFPDVPWRDGGVKVYHDDIYVLSSDRAAWRSAGRLLVPLGYAGVISVPGGVFVAGGENAAGVRAEAFLLRLENGLVELLPMPDLPAPRSSPAVGLLNGKVYLAGGFGPEPGRPATQDFWSLDLENTAAGWIALAPWPGPARGQAVAAVTGGAFYLVSGLEVTGGKSSPRYLVDAYRFRPGAGWEMLPPPPRSVVAAPSPAPVTAEPARAIVLGGVDGRLVGHQPVGTRVPAEILVYSADREKWESVPERWPAPVVTGPAVQVGEEWLIVSGEIMAGIRTDEVWAMRPADWVE
jgi:N-acetylneuraminate epimerase